MKILIPMLLVAVWCLWVWVFDPLRIEDKFVTDTAGFLYWLLGAALAGLTGLVMASIWGKRSWKSGF